MCFFIESGRFVGMFSRYFYKLKPFYLKNSMRFVRETHSIEVVVSPQKNSHLLKSTTRKRPSIPRLRLKDKKFVEPGADNCRYLPEESSNSNYSGAGSGASGIQNQMRARSESQCEYR